LGGLRDRGPAAGLHRPAPGDVFDLLVEYGPAHLRPIRLYMEHSPLAGRSRWYQDRGRILAKLAGAPQGCTACGASLRLARLHEWCGRPSLVPHRSRPASEPEGATRPPAHRLGRWQGQGVCSGHHALFPRATRQRYTDVGFAGARLRHGSAQTSPRADHAQGGDAQERPGRGTEGLPGRPRQGATSGRVDKEYGMAVTQAQQARRGRTRRREAYDVLLFVLPWLLSLLLFTAYPVLTTLSLSFTDYNIVQPRGGLACRTTAPCSPPTRRSGHRSGTVRITPCSPFLSGW